MRWTSQDEKQKSVTNVSYLWSLHPRKGLLWQAGSPQTVITYTKKHTLTQSPFPSSFLRGLPLKITHSIFSHTQSDLHRYRRACSLSHTHFQKLDTHCNPVPLTLCVLLFLTSFPLFPSTLWKPLLRDTKSVISLVVLMHQTFLISSTEKRAAQR